MEAFAMTKAISRFEVHLLRVLRGIVQQAPVEQVLPLLVKPLPRPKCLSRAAVELVQDTLAKGSVHFLARRGWRRERFLRTGKIADGRLWERSSPKDLALTFSPHALELLIQLVSGTVGSTVPKIDELTIGDRLLLFLAFNLLRHTAVADQLETKWLPLHQDGLCRLFFTEELTEAAQRFRIDWLTWTERPGADILEALQGPLADRWVEVERRKETTTTVARMRKIGTTQTRVVGEYLDALAPAKRWDLARCLLETARRLLHDQPTARKWIRNLDVSKERLANRLATYHDALALVRQLERLRQWQQEAVAVGYFDEGYAASQLWKADWERFDAAAVCEHASAILREVEPI
jgi:hypothetical protein